MAALFSCACHDVAAPIVGVSPPRAPERSAATPDAAPAERSPVPTDFRSSMTRIGDRFLSQGHARRFDAIIWANVPAAERWAAPESMPDGSMILEEVIMNDRGFAEPAGLLVMEKRANEWRFVVVTTGGDVIGDSRTAPCTKCHGEVEGGVFILSQDAGLGAERLATPDARDSSS